MLPDPGCCEACNAPRKADPDFCPACLALMAASRRQTPAEYAREVFDTLTANGSDYPSAMREARIALHDCRADDAELLAQTCPDHAPAEWSA